MRAPDLTLALRNLVRRPGFAVTAVLLLALGAGANAAVFSVVRGVLLKPLPYRDPGRLVAVWPDSFVSNEEVGFWRDRAHSFEAVSAVSPGWMMALVADGVEPIKVTGGRTADNFFETLGVRAMLGRTLETGDAAPTRPRVVVLSAAVYQRQFSGDAGVIGRTVRLDNVPHEIVGVMPPGFEFLGPGTDVWTALPFDPTSPQHRTGFSQAFARLRPGVPPDAATRELQELTPRMRRDLGRAVDWGGDIRVTPLRDAVTGDLRPTLLVLTAAVGLILLLAATNLATLLLGRTIERSREMAVRAALGASRGRLVRQLVAEQCVLAAAGAAVGLLLARALLPALVAHIPADTPRQADIALDGAVVLVVFGVTVLVATAIGLTPVLMAARPALQSTLRQTPATDTPLRRRALGGLVAAQIAVAVALGIGAGLMLRSLWLLQRVDPGFEPGGVLTFRLQTTSKHSSLAAGLPYLQQVAERVGALPGVTHVGAIQHLPMTGYNWTARVHPVERPPAPGTTAPQVVWRFVGWDYFESMRIPLRAGRRFTTADHVKAPLVAIVNETFARREFGTAEAALGRRVTTCCAQGTQIVEVVGVVNDVRFRSLDRLAEPELYRPIAQTFMFPMAFVVRTTAAPAAIAAAVRQAAYAVDPTIPVAELQPLTSLVAGTLGRPRLLMFLLTVFAGVGLLLGVVGVYGVVAYRVRQQQRELGIRLALGAAPGAITRRVLRHGVVHAVAGIALGLPLAYALARLMESLVFGVTTTDPLTFAALPAVIATAVIGACLLPARRAARVDPVAVLRGQ